MIQKIKECQNGNYPKNMAPFFWQHGDSHDELRKMIDIMHSSNMDAFCVESRVHEEFGEEKWWDDFCFILEEAKKRDMKVWLLDDKHFPSGFANFYLREHPELVRKLIRECHIDVWGPQKQVSLFTNQHQQGERLLHILAYKRANDGRILTDSCIELTKLASGTFLTWNVPEGCWRVFFLIETTGLHDHKTDKQYYIDMLSRESCHAMIDAVYQPHYEHLSEYFGNTFLGFFSDEPGFNNDNSTYHATLGRMNVSLPWNAELISMISERQSMTERDVIAMLPGLWFDLHEDTDVIRYGYMDAVTKRYRYCFSKQIGDWCREHQVSYIGHVIEDVNAHMRLGYGSGHFFRAMEGQDMSGLDVVLYEIVPGLSEHTHQALLPVDGAEVDPEFFDYTLAKLAVSASHLDPKKQNRCMCELFGAYGWVEGLPTMKYLADHMIVNGVNYFVPHAFTNRYPNSDCPPHFWAEGNNPQYAYFGELMNYMNRCVHLLSDSTHHADVAVYYNAEGEWCGGKYMLFQKITKLLTQNQIDFDIVPQDILRDTASVKDGKLCIGKETYGALLVSYSELLPNELLELFSKLAGQGLRIIFADDLPKGIENSKQLFALPLQDIPSYLVEENLLSLHVSNTCPNLRFYHVTREDEHIMMFFNDSLTDDIDTEVQLPFTGTLTWYDPWTKEYWNEHSDNGIVRMGLARNCTLFVMTGTPEDTDIKEKRTQMSSTWKPELLFDIYLQENGKQEYCYTKQSPLINISATNHLPEFCGKIRYITNFVAENASDIERLDLGTVGETAEVYVNDQYCGLRIQAPYSFSLSPHIKSGGNKLEILVANNPVYRERDDFSRLSPLPPSGIIGDIVFHAK